MTNGHWPPFVCFQHARMCSYMSYMSSWAHGTQLLYFSLQSQPASKGWNLREDEMEPWISLISSQDALHPPEYFLLHKTDFLWSCGARSHSCRHCQVQLSGGSSVWAAVKHHSWKIWFRVQLTAEIFSMWNLSIMWKDCQRSRFFWNIKWENCSDVCSLES